MIQKLFLLSILVLTPLISFSSFAAIQFSPSGSTQFVGNLEGGAPVPPSLCPAGMLAVGMEGSEVNDQNKPTELGYMSTYATRCGEPKIDPATSVVGLAYTVSTPLTNTAQSTSSGPIKSLDCPTNMAMVGYSGFQRANDKYKMADGITPKKLVDALRPRCAKISFDKTLNKLVTSTATDADATLSVIPSPAGAGAEAIANADCAANTVVNGFVGRVGNLFDKFELACAKIDATAITIDINNANPSDYQVVLNTEPKTMDIIGLNKSPIIAQPGMYSMALVRKSDGKRFENFDCKSVTAATPYMIKLEMDKPLSCTVKPDPNSGTTVATASSAATVANGTPIGYDWLAPFLITVGTVLPLATLLLIGAFRKKSE
jgi:hypothetical protein